MILYNVRMPNASQLKHLGSVVRDIRQSKGWTLKQLSDVSGVGYSYASNIERGYVNPARGPVTPSDDILYLLAKALDIPISTLHGALGRVADSPGPASKPPAPDAQQVLNSIKRILAEPEDYLRRIGEDADVSDTYSTPLSPLRASAGDLRAVREVGQDYETVRDAMPHQTRAIRVTGECMAPFYQDGDIVIVRETPFAENGQQVIALVDDECLSCKIFRANGTNYLEPVNGEGRISGERFRIIGVIVKLIRDV